MRYCLDIDTIKTSDSENCCDWNKNYKTIFSVMLCEEKLVNVLNAIYAVTIQANTLMKAVMSSALVKPARYRITYANRARITAETILMILNRGVSVPAFHPRPS